MKIVFQGDSITDDHRDQSNPHDMGPGYPKFASEQICAAYPDTAFEFWNFGIIGNRTEQLLDRLQAEGIEQQPDVISVLIGINDIWIIHSKDEKVPLTEEQFLANYREIITRLRAETNAKILMISPYILDGGTIVEARPLFDRLVPQMRAIAEELADAYLPLNEHFDEAIKAQPSPMYYSGDGVHPNQRGAAFIAEHYARAIAPFLEQPRRSIL